MTIKTVMIEAYKNRFQKIGGENIPRSDGHPIAERAGVHHQSGFVRQSYMKLHA